MGTKNGSTISRREFARRAAFVSAAASLSPAGLLSANSGAAAAPALQSANSPKLSAESQAEMESRLKAIFAQYGNRLSNAQKDDLKRLAHDSQQMLDRLRAYPTANEDSPGLYLKPLIERERKPTTKPAAAKPAVTPKKP
jgi:hypothetical protein